MQKTLYISDLDGTLLSPDAQISAYTEKTINTLIEKGLNFSIASARGSSVFKLIKNLNIKTPFVLMNGALIYDPVKKCYIKNEIFNPGTVEKIIKIMNESDICGHYFSINENSTDENSFNEISSVENPDFTDEFFDKSKSIRRIAFNKDNKIICKRNKIIFYFSLLDTREKLDPLNNALKEFNDIKIEYYRDVYTEDKWFFEVFDSKASKFSAVDFLRKNCGFERVICFGDNYNDLPMFRASDECYATGNAAEEVKAAATAVIGKNSEDGVAAWIYENYCKY